MMTLDTEQGPIQVPVDVQAASKVADEKRKRNATASHRFRQRRKEKEKETSQNIERLEHQIRDITEEREFYRLERDYFRNIACNGPAQAHVAPRPPSPRQVRMASMSSSGSIGGNQWHEKDENNLNGRNTRRRTSSYTPATGFVPPVSGPPAPMPPYVANEHLHQRPLSGPTSALIGPPIQTGSYDHSSYHRGWKP